MKQEPMIAWEERRERRHTEFVKKIKELSRRNRALEDQLHVIHDISKMNSFAEAITKEKKKRSCIIL